MRMRHPHKPEPVAVDNLETATEDGDQKDHLKFVKQRKKNITISDVLNDCGNVFDKTTNICNVCEKEFSIPKYLKDHIRKVHGSTETVSCEECGKQYAGNTRLYHHIRAVHQLIQSTCEYCGKMYKNKDLLKKHARLYHKPSS